MLFLFSVIEDSGDLTSLHNWPALDITYADPAISM